MSTRPEAAQRAEDIRLGIQQTAVLYARAVTEHDWQTLGYQSVTQWAHCEFGPDRFSTERRQEIVALLTDSGYTLRQIAAATGAHPRTIQRDQEASPRAANAAPENANPRQQAARERDARRRTTRPAQNRNGGPPRTSGQTAQSTDGDAQTPSGQPAAEDENRRKRERLTEAIAGQATRAVGSALDPGSDLGKQLAYLRDNHELLSQISKLNLARALSDLAETASRHHDHLLGLNVEQETS